MVDALYGTTIYHQFAGGRLERIAGDTTLLNFRRLLEKHELATGMLVVINGNQQWLKTAGNTGLLQAILNKR